MTIHKNSSLLSETAVGTMRFWLVLLGVLVYGMILVGGATRLTDSGLSITEWKPISGALPPFGRAEWEALFDLYKETAEYRLQNAGMSLSEFQYIYWWEWGHRLMGRAIGMVAILGLVFFAWRGWLQRGLIWKLPLLVALGGLQGAIGWWMVASGIGDTSRVDVAPYRLMTHFSLALIILCYIYWLWMDLTLKPIRMRTSSLAFPVMFVLIFLQMAAGALVAGLDAGRTYTDWPLMAGEVIPGGYWAADLGIRNVFENVATTQFNHRILAYVILAFSIYMLLRFRGHWGRFGLRLFVFFVGLQVVWGITTLVFAAPLELALVHQGIGVLVLLTCLRTNYLSRRAVG
jgi:cytochrome c oxidase assembly protein subunit 15